MRPLTIAELGLVAGGYNDTSDPYGGWNGGGGSYGGGTGDETPPSGGGTTSPAVGTPVYQAITNTIYTDPNETGGSQPSNGTDQNSYDYMSLGQWLSMRFDMGFEAFVGYASSYFAEQRYYQQQAQDAAVHAANQVSAWAQGVLQGGDTVGPNGKVTITYGDNIRGGGTVHLVPLAPGHAIHIDMYSASGAIGLGVEGSWGTATWRGTDGHTYQIDIGSGGMVVGGGVALLHQTAVANSFSAVFGVSVEAQGAFAAGPVAAGGSVSVPVPGNGVAVGTTVGGGGGGVSVAAVAVEPTSGPRLVQ